MPQTTHEKLKDREFFFIVGDPKTPYRRIGKQYLNMTTNKLENFPPSSEEPLRVKKALEWDVRKKYGMSMVQFDAWLERVEKKAK